MSKGLELHGWKVRRPVARYWTRFTAAIFALRVALREPVTERIVTITALDEAALTRGGYFIARHPWLTVKKQWTCLAADRDHGWTAKDFDTFVANHHWKFARTMAENPHEYSLRRNAKHSVFDDAIRYIRDVGVIEYFSGKPYKMLHHGGHKYWTMGAPLALTALINRKKTDGESETPQPPSGVLPFFPFLPSSVEQLPRRLLRHRWQGRRRR